MSRLQQVLRRPKWSDQAPGGGESRFSWKKIFDCLFVQVHAQEKSFHCSQCDKSFKELRTLRLHLKIHNSEYPEHCEVCKKGFRTKWQVRSNTFSNMFFFCVSVHCIRIHVYMILRFPVKTAFDGPRRKATISVPRVHLHL